MDSEISSLAILKSVWGARATTRARYTRLVSLGIPPLGLVLKRLRSSTGISQAEMAKRLHVHVNTVSSLEQGRTNPRQSTIQRYLESLEIGAKDFADSLEIVARELGHSPPPEAREDPLSQLGKALRTVRLQGGFATVGQLAEALGVTKWDLSAYEDGDPMNTMTLREILKACNADLSDLAAAVADPVDIEGMRRDMNQLTAQLTEMQQLKAEVEELRAAVARICQEKT